MATANVVTITAGAWRPLWVGEDEICMFDRERLEHHQEWKDETYAEVGSEYFIDTHNSCDANFFASQWVNERVCKMLGGKSEAQVQGFYDRLYGGRK